MNRQELKNLLRGVENSGEIIDAIMEINGADIENAKKNAASTFAEENKALKAQLKSYEKGGEKYTDPDEISRLKAFEKDTLEKESKTKKEAAIKKLFHDANASDSVTRLFIKGQDLSTIELDDKGEVKGGADIIKQAKADYADLFGNGNAGVPQNNTQNEADNQPKKEQVVF